MQSFKLTRIACFFTYLAIAPIFAMPPLLFVTFRETYGISYTLLGTLVLINFCTQLSVDLVFSFFTRLFPIHNSLRVMPLLTSAGLLLYALVPYFFPQYAYVGLVIGTVVFSVSAGLSEVLLSPVVAAIPSDTPDRDMSLLHSLYAVGVLIAVLVSTAFLAVFGAENWMFLATFFAALPLISFVLFCICPLPPLSLSLGGKDGVSIRNRRLVSCVLCIFLGSAAENIMTNWVSAYMENALLIPKSVGDILGMALFAILLGGGRILYARFGRNIAKVLLFSMIGAALCYLTACVSPLPVLSVLACVLTGLCTAMLWPGSLILMEERVPNLGVAAYALMAAGGDFGASIAPQMMGVVVDAVSESAWSTSLGAMLSLSPEQVGMRGGMLLASVFPLCGIAVVARLMRGKKA